MINDSLVDFQEQYFEFLQEKKTAGIKLIAYSAHEFVPDELIRSVGAFPVPLIYAGDEDRSALGGGYLTPTMCPFALSQMGAFFVHKDTGQYRFLSLIDAFIITNYCTAAQLSAEMITDQFQIQRFDLHIPYLQTDAHRIYYQSELQRLVNEIAELTKHPYYDGDLLKEIEKQQNLELLLKKLTNSLSASEMLKIQYAAKLFGPDPALIEALKSYTENQMNKTNVKPKVSKKIILTGCAVFIDDPLLDFIEDCGGQVVFNDTWLGDQRFLNDNGDNILPDSALAPPMDILTYRFQANIDSPHCAPNYVANYVRKIVQICEKTQTKAVINHILKFCDLIGHHRQEIKDRLNNAGIQVLNLERDYSKSMSGQLRTRIEAFMEMID